MRECCLKLAYSRDNIILLYLLLYFNAGCLYLGTEVYIVEFVDIIWQSVTIVSVVNTPSFSRLHLIRQNVAQQSFLLSAWIFTNQDTLYLILWNKHIQKRICQGLKFLSGIGDSVMEGRYLEMSRDPAIRVQLSVVATLVKIVKDR